MWRAPERRASASANLGSDFEDLEHTSGSFLLGQSIHLPTMLRMSFCGHCNIGVTVQRMALAIARAWQLHG